MTRREKAIALLQQHAAAKQALQNLPLLEPQSPAQRLQARKDFRELRKRVRLVEQALAALNPEERLVIHRFFIQPPRRKLDQLRMELGVEQSTVYRRRDKALFKFTEALFGPSAP